MSKEHRNPYASYTTASDKCNHRKYVSRNKTRSPWYIAPALAETAAEFLNAHESPLSDEARLRLEKLLIAEHNVSHSTAKTAAVKAIAQHAEQKMQTLIHYCESVINLCVKENPDAPSNAIVDVVTNFLMERRGASVEDIKDALGGYDGILHRVNAAQERKNHNE